MNIPVLQPKIVSTKEIEPAIVEQTEKLKNRDLNIRKIILNIMFVPYVQEKNKFIPIKFRYHEEISMDFRIEDGGIFQEDEFSSRLSTILNEDFAEMRTRDGACLSKVKWEATIHGEEKNILSRNVIVRMEGISKYFFSKKTNSWKFQNLVASPVSNRLNNNNNNNNAHNNQPSISPILIDDSAQNNNNNDSNAHNNQPSISPILINDNAQNNNNSNPNNSNNAYNYQQPVSAILIDDNTINNNNAHNNRPKYNISPTQNALNNNNSHNISSPVSTLLFTNNTVSTNNHYYNRPLFNIPPTHPVNNNSRPIPSPVPTILFSDNRFNNNNSHNNQLQINTTNNNNSRNNPTQYLYIPE